MEKHCCASNNNIMLLACSGGSNKGAALQPGGREFTQEGFGKMYCLAGIGGQLKGFVQSAKDVPVIAAIDGCPVGCARAILKNAGIQTHNYIVLTELGIEKNKNFKLNNEDILRVKEAVVAACKGQKTEAQAAKLSRAVGRCG